MPRYIELLTGAVAYPLLVMPFFVGGCSSTTNTEETLTLHLYNPFQLPDIDPSATGHAPYFHGAIYDFELTKMEPVGTCGWYSITFPKAPGDFRFFGSDSSGPQWGLEGLGSMTNFNQDQLFELTNDVYATPDASSGVTEFTAERPFECDPAEAGFENPYVKGGLPDQADPSQISALYAAWLTNFYEEQGELARIRFDEPGETVSQGIGYGMLITVSADDPEAQERFESLLAYKNAFSNDEGLMHQRIEGFDSVLETGAATDASLDIATALILASRKWDSPTYLDAAMTIIDAIRTTGFDSAGYLKAGDLWQDGQALNPSYFSHVAFQLFSEVDSDNVDFWQNAILRHYAVIRGGQNVFTGLIANWTDASGSPQEPPDAATYPGWENFGLDAIRVPWRAAWAALWYGDRTNHTPARDIARRFCAFAAGITGEDPIALKSEYSLAGGPGTEDAGPGAIGAFAAACMLDSSNKPFRTASYDLIRTETMGYDITASEAGLRVLTALLLSGAMPPPPNGSTP